MRWRGPVVLAVLVAAGIVGGFAVSLALAEHPTDGGTAAPVAAQSPSLPVDPVPDLLPDPDFAPLDGSLPLVRQVVGAGDFRMSLPTPRGWRFSENSLNEWQWRPPDQPSFGYLVRVEQVLSNRRSIAWTLDRRIDELEEDEQAVRVLGRTDATLHYSYVASNHLRHGYLTWLDLTGSDNAQVEIAVSGRARDQDGMAELIGRIAAGTRLG
ncbi:hypothetical protein KDN32_00210 [Nocardioides sp. J2M5]|uniref:hypothetical protein n=1 Tax=Nocardioides palaemonis TaxID=2829810 RepID=UPI001BA5E33A|nr:hypothetical protein [Nocardioides palaemonis]MBS2936161.1 hypothetical protein [Nocardioides palaemonis]